MEKLSTSKINQLREDLIAFNDAYRKGKPQISDIEYDHLVEVLWENSPQDEFFKRGIVEQPTERMEKLPLPMYSLEKIKTVQAFRKWLEKMSAAGCREVVSTPKFDGISLIVDELTHKAWTRGDGVEGQKSDKHFSRMNSVHSDNSKYAHPDYTWGEAIIKKITFAQLQDNPKFEYKNARNMVAGLFNAPGGYHSPYIRNVDFIRYGSDLPLNKGEQLAEMKEIYGKNVSDSVEVFIEEILELSDDELNIFLDKELHDRFDDEYKIDGVVIEVNEYEIREKLGRLPNGNPAYAIAFKREEWCDAYQTRVTGIELGVGKTGVVNPVILVNPVEINGATVNRVTGYNMSYMIDNRICKGALIEITRGGDVIPKHLKTLSFNNNVFEQFMDECVVCPSCGEPLKWDTTMVNLVCLNEGCKEKVISELTYFFRTMGCEEFEEPTLRKLYNAGYKTVDSIISLQTDQLQELLGEINGRVVSKQIMRVITEGVPYARYLAALNIFDGKIAETTCQKILDNLSEEYVHHIIREDIHLDNSVEMRYLIDTLVKIPGIGQTIAKVFVEGLQRKRRIKQFKVNFSYIQSPKQTSPVDGERMYVCFTGFRDKELESTLIAKGHVVLNSVTKECTLLVVKDLNSTSSKMDTARKRGIRIVNREEFTNEILLSR